MTPTGPAEFDNFNGGFTDTYLDGPLNKCRRAENILLVPYNDVKGKLTSRPGSTIYDEDNPQAPGGNVRIGALRFFESLLLTNQVEDLYYISGGTFNTLQGPTGNPIFNGLTSDGVLSFSTVWAHHLFAASSDFHRPAKIYVDGSDVLQLRTAGMPDLASDPVIVPTAGAGIYIYRFLHKYTYQVGTVTFLDRGPTTEVIVPNSATVGSNAISAIPVLANGTDYNYDTTNVKIEIYRTVLNGAAFFRVDEVSNGTTTYTDTVSDATLQGNEALYTEGGVVENDPPPLSQIVHVTEDTGYYACIKEGTEIRYNRLRQSIVGDLDSAPADFFVDVEDDIIGLSSVRGVPVLLCKNSVFRVDGRYDELGRGGMIAQRISDTASCIGSASVVQTLEGVFWWGTDAVYFTDGVRVIKLNDDWPTTHKLYVVTAEQRRRIYGRYDSTNRRIWWSVQELSEVDTNIVLDLNWGIREMMPFTRQGNGSDSWAPTAIEFLDGDLVRGDKRGYLFQHSETEFQDPKIDTTIPAEDWNTEAIIYDYESCHFNFGSNYERKFITRISFQAKNLTNLSLQIISDNDDGKKLASLKPVRFRANLVWGLSEVVWGDPSPIWNYSGFIEEWRRFPAKSLRCSYKGVRFTNAFVVITTSDLSCTADVDSGAKTATLTNTIDFDWPSNLLDYYIAFPDNWDLEFRILDYTGDVITYEDTANVSVAALDAEWEIRGKPKNEVFYLISYTIHFAEFGKTQATFTPSQTGSIVP